MSYSSEQNLLFSQLWNDAIEFYDNNNLERAIEVYEKLINKGCYEAYKQLGKIFIKIDILKSINYFEKSIEYTNDFESCVCVIGIYVENPKYDTDLSQIEKYLKKLKDSQSQFYNLVKGELYEYGVFEKNYNQAEKFYRASFKDGNLIALARLARLQLRQHHYIRWIFNTSKVFFIAVFLYIKNPNDLRLKSTGINWMIEKREVD